jgi:hypothetical protein
MRHAPLSKDVVRIGLMLGFILGGIGAVICYWRGKRAALNHNVTIALAYYAGFCLSIAILSGCFLLGGQIDYQSGWLWFS